MVTVHAPNINRFIAALSLAVMVLVSTGVFITVARENVAKAAAIIEFKSESSDSFSHPALSDRYLVYVRESAGSPSLWLYDFSEKIDTKVSDLHMTPAESTGPIAAISGDRLVFVDFVANCAPFDSPCYIIYQFQAPLSTVTEAIRVNQMPRDLQMHGNDLLWKQTTGGVQRLMHYDLATRRLAEIASDSNEIYGALGAGKVAVARAEVAGGSVTGAFAVELVNIASHASETVRKGVLGFGGISFNEEEVVWIDFHDGVLEIHAYDVRYGTEKTDATIGASPAKEPLASTRSYHLWAEPTAAGIGLVHFDRTTKARTVILDDIAAPMSITNGGTRIAWHALKNGATSIFIYDSLLKAVDFDQDKDGLSEAWEAEVKTHPFSFDTDSDGLSDSEEVVLYRTSPTRVDSDGDSLTDYQETFVYNTDPGNFDTDDDTFNDGVEVATGNNPLVSAFAGEPYGKERLPADVQKAYEVALRETLVATFGSMPKLSSADWKMYLDAYIYGGYTNSEILAAIGGFDDAVSSKFAAADWRQMQGLSIASVGQ